MHVGHLYHKVKFLTPEGTWSSGTRCQGVIVTASGHSTATQPLRSRSVPTGPHGPSQVLVCTAAHCCSASTGLGSASPPVGGLSSPGKLVLQMEAGVGNFTSAEKEEGSSGASDLHSHPGLCCLWDHGRQELSEPVQALCCRHA